MNGVVGSFLFECQSCGPNRICVAKRVVFQTTREPNTKYIEKKRKEKKMVICEVLPKHRRTLRVPTTLRDLLEGYTVRSRVDCSPHYGSCSMCSDRGRSPYRNTVGNKPRLSQNSLEYRYPQPRPQQCRGRRISSIYLAILE